MSSKWARPALPTPEEAKERYEAEWPALHAAKEAAQTPEEAKKCRQALSALSLRYAARFKLVKDNPMTWPEPTTCAVRFCPCCGKPVSHDS